MAAKGGGTQGYRYLMSLLSGLCRGPVDEMIEIKVGDKQAWNGHACSNITRQIDAPDLFGGDDKEGGVQGPFAVYMGEPDQVLPGATGGLPDVQASIGGLVSQMRGVVTVWFDGMVSAMNPYLKEWKFRVRRSTAGWHNDECWYPDKATIYLGGNVISVATNKPIALPVTEDSDAGTMTITFSRNAEATDSVTVNGVTIDYVEKDAGDLEIVPNSTRARSVRNLANYVNARSTTFKATATYDATTVTFKADTAQQDIYAMNASHIVFQAYTDPLWGRGLPWSDMDENSFILAANTLCSEGFGLCIGWYRKEDISVFIQKVCDLVGGVSYTDRETGKIVFRLVRNDYDLDDVPLFTPETGLLSISDDDSASSDNSFNEIIGTSLDPITNNEFQVRAQNLAAFQAQGNISSSDQDYKGIPTKPLLQRVVLRDLRAMASGLKKYNISLDRRGWRVAPGSVIRISHPGRGIVNAVLRVAEIDDGNMVNGEIKIKAAIDFFGLPATSYAESVDTGWIAPSKVAAAAADERLVEASYRDLYRQLGAGDAQAADPTSAYVGQLAVAPNTTSLEYDLLTRADGEPDYVDRGRGNFTGNALLADDIDPLDTVFDYTNPAMFDAGNVGQALLIGDELVRLDDIDETDKTITVARGVGDTIPQAHEVAETIWTIDDDLVGDGIAYTAGETVFAKVLTRTSSQVLDEALADEQEIELVGRPARPYPPADVQVGGLSVFDVTGEQSEPVITWAERNRITQADHLVGHGEAAVLAEEDTTYTIRIYDADGTTLLRTEDGIADSTWTYDATMQAADGSGSVVFMELESVRDDLVSWQHYRFRIVLNGGWGYGWGFNWGAPRLTEVTSENIMAKRALPNLGLVGNFADGEDEWGADMDATLLKLSALVQGGAKSRLAAVPGSPAQGDVHVLTAGANAQKVAVYDGGAWTYYTPTEGWLLYDQATNEHITFDGAAWVALETGGGGGDGLPAGGTTGQVLTKQSGTDGDADWETPSGGGGGGGGFQTVGKRINGGPAWGGNTATDGVIVPSSDFTFTAPADGLYRIHYFIHYTNSHRVRANIYCDNARLNPGEVGSGKFDFYSSLENDSNWWLVNAHTLAELTAGEHTIELRYNAMDSTANGGTSGNSYVIVTYVGDDF